MALTLADVARGAFGHKRFVVTTVTFDSSYPTGGESLTAADLGLVSIDAVLPCAAVNATPVAVVTTYDKTNSKLLAFQADGAASGLASLAQVANTTDLSAFSTVICVIGI